MSDVIDKAIEHVESARRKQWPRNPIKERAALLDEVFRKLRCAENKLEVLRKTLG
jgi:acyl-CoA reductase-like NAD-dependent aldehyde dehydrogenase